MDSKGYQEELFEEFGRPRRKPRFLRKRKFPQKFFTLRLSQEKLVFLTIGLVVLFLVSFSLGVERGKRISEISPGMSKDENLKESTRNHEAKIESERQEPVLATLEKETPRAKVPNSYAIQVATYKRKELAQRELTQLRNKGYNPFILTRGAYFEVYVGPYSDKANAVASLKRLKKQYGDCLLRRM